MSIERDLQYFGHEPLDPPKKSARPGIREALATALCRAALRGWKRGRRNQDSEAEQIAGELLADPEVAALLSTLQGSPEGTREEGGLRPRIQGDLFGINIVPGSSSSGLLCSLFLEDDDHWHEKCQFDAFWLRDLARVAGKAAASVEFTGEDAWRMRLANGDPASSQVEEELALLDALMLELKGSWPQYAHYRNRLNEIRGLNGDPASGETPTTKGEIQ